MNLIETIRDFCETENKKWSHLRVDPAYSFGHIVLGDYNLSDESIDFCLGEMWDWFYQQYKDLDAVDYASPNYWDNCNWFDLVQATENTIEFLEWLKTVPLDERENSSEAYWG